jgi:hypothetical protein
MWKIFVTGVVICFSVLFVCGCDSQREGNSMSSSDKNGSDSASVEKREDFGQYEKATLAAGCFWGVEAAFAKIPGVVSTQVGYTGGHTQNPTYKQGVQV